MPGLMIRLIMNALKKSKPNNIHYVPRNYEAVRNQGRENSTKLPLPKNTVKEKTPYGCWYCKPGANRKKVLFYIHGGGFNSGGAEYSINMTRNFCKSDNYAVFNVEYRLAPEHPFPAGLEDCISAYRYLTQQGGAEAIWCLPATQPAATWCSPWRCICGTTGWNCPPGYAPFHRWGLWMTACPPAKSGSTGTASSAPTSPRKCRSPTLVTTMSVPRISRPSMGTLWVCPPIWMCVGTEEVFYDDAIALQAAAQNKGIPVELLIGKGMCHVYPMFPDRQSKTAIESMRSFIEKRLRVSKS